jgi:hypothetical protein
MVVVVGVGEEEVASHEHALGEEGTGRKGEGVGEGRVVLWYLCWKRAQEYGYGCG